MSDSTTSMSQELRIHYDEQNRQDLYFQGIFFLFGGNSQSITVNSKV